jgi:hypothetical protein
MRGETWFSMVLLGSIVGIFLNQRNSTNNEETDS